mmetsp:Transcript_29078/g.67433  ORF Transcript_29078/g.67433 Transcript_29078/m.67433 type:complete len:236 (+) Transcript_29078:2087-2794(+)
MQLTRSITRAGSCTTPSTALQTNAGTTSVTTYTLFVTPTRYAVLSTPRATPGASRGTSTLTNRQTRPQPVGRSETSTSHTRRPPLASAVHAASKPCAALAATCTMQLQAVSGASTAAKRAIRCPAPRKADCTLSATCTMQLQTVPGVSTTKRAIRCAAPRKADCTLSAPCLRAEGMSVVRSDTSVSLTCTSASLTCTLTCTSVREAWSAMRRASEGTSRARAALRWRNACCRIAS